MPVFNNQKQSVLEVIQQAEKLAASFKKNKLSKRISEIKEHLAAEKLFVVVCGEFKQGKSSMINAFLDEPGLCPVDIDIATNIVSTIGYGRTEKITVLKGKRGEEEVKEITREEIADFGTEKKNKGNIQGTRLINLEIPNPLLQQNLILVDTPGVGGLNTDHTDLTFAFLPNADVILFVSDVLAPLSAVELESVQNIHQHCKKIIFVMTKIDSVSDYESVIENNRKKLVQVLEAGENEPLIIPVSALSKLDYLQSNDLEDMEDSNFTVLEETIWDLINQHKGAMLLMGALDRVSGELSFLKQPFQAEWETCHKKNQTELEEQKRQFTTSKERLSALLENNADWRVQLSDGLQDLRRNMTAQFQEGFMKIRYGMRTSLEDPDMIQSPQKVLQRCEYQIDSLMTDLGQRLSEAAEALYDTIEQSSHLHLTRHESEPLKLRKTISPELFPHSQQNTNAEEGVLGDSNQLWKKSRSAARSGLFNLHAGAFVGGVVGVIIGGGVGLFAGGISAIPGMVAGAQWGAGIGAVGGFASGAKEGLYQIQEKDQKLAQQKVSKVVSQFIEESQNCCLQTLTETITQLERSIRDNFSRQLKQEKNTNEDALKRIQQTGILTRKETEKKSAELKVSINKINLIFQNLESLSKEIFQETTPEAVNHEKESQDLGDWADA
ncbi:MAG: dynamin family protein [Desulfobacula sp.]|uniref:dynamin family protein n=1 Tax=Desulfobacula sp. TaxID=2593537 RepID=UPI0025C077A4|nr:dynamin family protein [Desulfobacula sp.]MCD4720206.1 dynamin family protein [Desulfobacula sp.]